MAKPQLNPETKPVFTKPTHVALRPVKLLGFPFGTGELLELDEATAAHLGVTAVEPYVVPVAAMTAAQLTEAAKEAVAREKAAKALALAVETAALEVAK